MEPWTPEPEWTAEPTPEPTAEPTTEPTEEPTPEPTEEPTPEPTEEPTPEPTEEPTPEPTEEPTPEPTAEPTPEPTEEPTPEPTEEPTPEPTEEPTEPEYPQVDENSDPEQITQLQNRLIELGWLAGEADGVYNEDTRAAVLAFQQKINADSLAELNEDGVADPLTMQWLFSEDAPVYQPEATPEENQGQAEEQA